MTRPPRHSRSYAEGEPPHTPASHRGPHQTRRRRKVIVGVTSLALVSALAFGAPAALAGSHGKNKGIGGSMLNTGGLDNSGITKQRPPHKRWHKKKGRHPRPKPSASPTQTSPATPACTERKGAPTLFGASVHPGKGQDYNAAVASTMQRYGKLQVIRRYFPGMPAPWSKIEKQDQGMTPSVSFNADAKQVIAGKYDQQLRQWFASAPTNHTVYWTYDHEPEKEVKEGKWSAADFRQAWIHIDKIADATHNDKLVSTLSLMTWTLRTKKRDWHDYFPGKQYVDVFAWDRYDTPVRTGKYGDPAMLFDPAIAAAKEAGVPFAFTEMGSKKVAGDDGSGRAAWLKASAKYLSDHGAVFVSYFDSTVGGEFRLLDDPSQEAWRAVVAHKVTC